MKQIKTKQEAIVLQGYFDNLLGKAMGGETTISLALTGRIKVDFDGKFITFNREDLSVDYMSYTGCYVGFLNAVETITSILQRPAIMHICWQIMTDMRMMTQVYQAIVHYLNYARNQQVEVLHHGTKYNSRQRLRNAYR